MHPPSLAARGNQARATKIGEVARYLWLAHSEDLDEVADTNFLIRDKIEEAKPGAVGQGAEKKFERNGFCFSFHPPPLYMA